MGTRKAVEYDLEILPVAQGRARARVANCRCRKGFVHFYDPGKSRDYKQSVNMLIREKGASQLEGPIFLDITFRMSKPKAYKYERDGIYHVKKPDISNLLKPVEDALEGLLMERDSQICKVSMEKVYSDVPGLTIRFEELDKFGEGGRLI